MEKTATRRHHYLTRQVERLGRREAGLVKENGRLSTIRLALFLVAILFAFVAFFNGLGWLWSFVGIIFMGFLIAVFFHRKLRNRLREVQIWRDLKQDQLARIDLRWDGLPTPLTPAPHPLATDIDLAGDVSVHRLLDTAVTVGGSEQLYAWLTEGAESIAEIEQRQAWVRELAPRVPFRDKLRLRARLAQGEETGRWQTDVVQTWLTNNPAPPVSGVTVGLLVGLAAINWILFLGSTFLGWSPLYPFSLIVYIVAFFWSARELGNLFGQAAELQDIFRQLSVVFEHVETSSYAQSPNIRELVAPFLQGDTPSKLLRQTGRVVSALGLRHNPLLWMMLNLVVPWDIYFAFRFGQQRAAIAERLPLWFERVFVLESAVSLATHTYLHPERIFPDVADTTSPALNAQQLTHPLLPATDGVANNFVVNERGDIALFTGSNMAGKSTFLRTVGVNLAIAYAGGVVAATQLTTTHFRLFSAINVTDSVSDGISYFYAEVKRLKGLLDALEGEGRPLIYFIDEIFRGTNNRERLIGSRTYIEALATHGGVGLISTHDLELTNLANTLPSLTNYHFREEVIEGRMVFDYLLREGPCPTTNALRVMALAGLPVPSIVDSSE